MLRDRRLRRHGRRALFTCTGDQAEREQQILDAHVRRIACDPLAGEGPHALDGGDLLGIFARELLRGIEHSFECLGESLKQRGPVVRISQSVSSSPLGDQKVTVRGGSDIPDRGTATRSDGRATAATSMISDASGRKRALLSRAMSKLTRREIIRGALAGAALGIVHGCSSGKSSTAPAKPAPPPVVKK